MKRVGLKSFWLLVGILGCLLLASPAAADKEFDKYALESVSSALSSVQAGAHADFTASFQLTKEEAEGTPYAFTRDILVSLPPGLIGNPQKFPRCALAQLGELPRREPVPAGCSGGNL